MMVPESRKKMDVNLNSIKYVELPKEKLIPYLNDGDIFQHDRDPCHKTCATQQYLAD